jgi:hypothetical protein
MFHMLAEADSGSGATLPSNPNAASRALRHNEALLQRAKG